MHILHVIQSLEFGGAEKVVIHLANRLSENHRVTLCLVKQRGELVADLVNDIEVIYLDLDEGVHFDLPRKLRNIILEKAVDIVNAHYWDIFLDSYLAVKMAGKAVVILTVHGPYTYYTPGIKSWLKKKLRHLLERFTARSQSVGKIVTVSDSIQEYIISDIGIPANKLLTIHNGIESMAIAKVENNSDEVKLITVGRLAAVKNYRLMIDAVHRSIGSNSKIRLTIVGEGPERTLLESHTRELGVTDHVQFLGFRDDIKELMSNHDIFVLSSDHEGISIALLEAMSLSMPTIATDVGGIPETIQHRKSGLLVPKGDVEKYAEAIIELSGSRPMQRELGAYAKQYFENNFHEEIVLNRYINLYQNCIGTSGG